MTDENTDNFEDFNGEATLIQPDVIESLPQNTIKQIGSSQIIVNLALGIKELVENSVDALANVIEIKFKNYGLEGFEVSDNGEGIEETDIHCVAKKHHTSKLREFSDLEHLDTFGFRGEGLYSLCALSDLTIVTRHKSSEYGTKIVLDHDGNIIERSICPRKVGTTVTITEFFKTLPLRKALFEENYRNEFNKTIQLLQEYCLVLLGIKIICSNQVKNGSRQTVFSTSGGKTVMENIISIFGTKQSQELVKINSPVSEENGKYTKESLLDIDATVEIQQSEIDKLNKINFVIEGYISNIDHKYGRSTKDRQFFYVNTRPAENSTFKKIANEIYNRYNKNRYPFLFLQLKMDRSNVDININKTKRKVMVCDEKILQLVLRKGLQNTFGKLAEKFYHTSLNSSVKSIGKESFVSDDDDDGDDKILAIKPNSNFGASLKQWKINPSNPFPKSSPIKRKINASQNSSQINKSRKIVEFLNVKAKTDSSDDYDDDKTEDKSEIDNLRLNETIEIHRKEDRDEDEEDVTHRITCKTNQIPNTLKVDFIRAKTAAAENDDEEKDVTHRITCKTLQTRDNTLKIDFVTPQEQSVDDDDENDCNESIQSMEKYILEMDSSQSKEEEFDAPKFNETLTRKINVSLEKVRLDAIEEDNIAFEENKTEQNKKPCKLKFKERIDPSKNKKAEAELETEIKKEMFKQMEVIGQFNLGFIIARLENDLFIVDQHASDEQFKFETIKNKLRLQSQKLVVPEKLELTSIQEDIIIENLDIFKMNGFEFEINESEDGKPRVLLCTRPYYKNWEFGKEDIDEMTFILSEVPRTICRPSRIRKMMASKACRMSVMIGTALNTAKMKQLLSNMSCIDHPWNCPHGRPTLRFLHNLDFIDTK